MFSQPLRHLPPTEARAESYVKRSSEGGGARSVWSATTMFPWHGRRSKLRVTCFAKEANSPGRTNGPQGETNRLIGLDGPMSWEAFLEGYSTGSSLVLSSAPVQIHGVGSTFSDVRGGGGHFSLTIIYP
jgi:hypothetical protein